MAGIFTSIKSIYSMASQVKTNHRLGYLKQFFDILALKRCNPTCSFTDYYCTGMYNKENCSRDKYREFAGWRVQQAVSLSLNPRFTTSAAWDKMTFAVIAAAHNIPVATTRAAFKSLGNLPNVIGHAMETIEEVRAFLKDKKNLPLFIKPCFGQQGMGGFYVTDYNVATDQVITKNDKIFSFDEFIENTINFPKRDYYRREAGYIFQDIIQQHKAITAFTGYDVPSGFRVVVLNDPDGPILHRAVWKVVAQGNCNDNFSLGKYGNLVANIDLKTGKIKRVADKFPPLAKNCEKHPLTGHSFQDFTIPLWKELVDQVLRASRVFSMMRILHWDIIMTDDGPVFLELNDIGGTEILQVNGQGVLDDVMVNYMRKHANLSDFKKLNKLING